MQTRRRFSPTRTATISMAAIGALGVVMAAPVRAASDMAVTLRAASGVADAATTADRTSAAHWVVDPAIPGDDLPSRGRSLFDFLVMQNEAGRKVQAVPFPFSALLQRIASATGRDERSAAPTAVLVPLGRSLQRNAAAPDFFAFPRAVVAVVAQPAGAGEPYLRDRVYLGYQEKANVVEVISYNEDEGRFEFQVVSDYRAGGTPKIAYANRTLCTACHQNAAPIFSRAAWDETNANPEVAKLLAAEREQFYGIPVDRGIDVPNAIDDAKLRANRFAVHQLLWKEGCGRDGEAAVACRADLFAAVLRYRLSGHSSPGGADQTYRARVADPLRAVVRARWPGGLAIGNPDIPNRNPLPARVPQAPGAALRDRAEVANVAAAFDPLVPRPALEVWRVDDDRDVARLVGGLADFLSAPDIERLDRALVARARAVRAVPRTYRALCTVDSAAAEGARQRVEFRCSPRSSVTDRGIAFEGRVFVTGNRIVGGALDRLEVEGLPASRDLDLDVRRSEARGAARRATATLMRGRLHARAADGNVLERIELTLGERDGEAAVIALDDFAAARNAIDELARDDVAGTFDGFDALAFRRARLMPALFARLGAKPDAWCCIDAAGMPPPRAARAEIPDLPAGESFRSATAASHAAFHRYCGECHRGADRAPPNFLLGSADDVEAKLRHCAPRIYYRLAMWHHGADARTKTPMPPEIALRRHSVGVPAWREGGALSGLLLAIDERLQSEGRAQTGEALLREGYESLRACLPDESAEVPAQPVRQVPDSGQPKQRPMAVPRGGEPRPLKGARDD